MALVSPIQSKPAATEDAAAPASRGETVFDRLRRTGHNAIEARALWDVAARGTAYARRGAVSSVQDAGDLIQATVIGSDPEPYHTAIRVDVTGEVDALCTCPYERGWCKHVVATIVHLLEPHAVTARAPRKSKVPRPFKPVISAAPLSEARAQTRRRRMRSLPPVDAQQVRRNVRLILHSLDHLRRSDAYWRVSEVTHALERVRTEAEARFANGDVVDAFKQLEVLTDEMCYAWEVLDDSDGLVGDLAREISGTWICWLLHPDVRPMLRRRYAGALERWQRAYSDYGVGEPFAAAAWVGRHGWDGDGPSELVTVKLDILEKRGDDENFLELAQRAGEIRRYALCQIRRGQVEAALGVFEGKMFDEQDVVAVAQALVEAGHIAQALAFALGIARRPEPLVSKHSWSAWDQRALIARWAAENAEWQGAAATALASAEVGFELEVDVEQYHRMKRLSGVGWPDLRKRLLERVLACAPQEAGAAVEILLEENWVEAAERLFDNHRGWCAEKTMWWLFLRAAESSPEWAAERALRFADEIMDRVERNRYERAARWLRIAAFALRRGEHADTWARHRAALIAKHKAKRALIPLILAVG